MFFSPKESWVEDNFHFKVIFWSFMTVGFSVEDIQITDWKVLGEGIVVLPGRIKYIPLKWLFLVSGHYGGARITLTYVKVVHY